jgi:CheY-like chemotaxis protein
MLTILVADDEFAVLEVVSLALEGEGHRVLKAGDGADALRLLSHHACDVVICDEQMPVMNGHQLVEAIRAEPRLAPTPVIMTCEMWGRPLPEIDGVVVLGKPILLARLFEEVARAATSRRRLEPGVLRASNLISDATATDAHARSLLRPRRAGAAADRSGGHPDLDRDVRAGACG